MNKSQKLEFQKDIENYLENKQVYNLFEDLLNQLIIQKPKDPLQFLINQLQQPIQKLIFLVGPPGSNARELALQLSDYKHYTCVSVGDLLIKEINKKSEEGEQLQKYKQDVVYAPDDLVNKIVIKHLQKLRNEKVSVILEGFPKTKVQGLMLQKLGFIPDCFVILNLKEGQDLDICTGRKLKKESWYINLNEEDQQRHLNSLKQEYLMHIAGVREIYKDFYFEVDGSTRGKRGRMPLLTQLARMMKFRIKSKAPQRSARIVIVGPPATNRSNISRMLARKYGFVHVCTRELVSNQIAKKTEVGRVCLEHLNQGKLVPNDIIMGLVHHRVNKTDCLIQGFVLDGFPKTMDQVDMLTSPKMKIQPSFVVVLELEGDQVTKRLKDRKIDPVSGNVYDNDGKDCETQAIFDRLVPLSNAHPKKIEKRLNRWNDLLEAIESCFSNSNSDDQIVRINASNAPEQVLEDIAFALENKS